MNDQVETVIESDATSGQAEEKQPATDGIYFDMPEDEYHALERFSSSGIQAMMISPATFWARSWMNPDKEEGNEAFKIVGKAYHAARLEPDTFYDRFFCELTADDFKGCDDVLRTDTDVKGALKDLGEAQTKKGENAPERALRLRDAGYAGVILSLEIAANRKKHEGKDELSADVWKQIHEDAKRLRQNPEIAALLKDGYPEVTILWTDPETGVKMKARLDYLRVGGFTDLKTFANGSGKELHRNLLDAFKYNRYFIQWGLYLAAYEMIRNGIAGEHLPVMDDCEDIRVFVEKIRADQATGIPWYVFQEKAGIPNTIAYCIPGVRLHASHDPAAPDDDALEAAAAKYSSPTRLLTKAGLEIKHAIKTFATYREVYGDDPWMPLAPIKHIDDEHFGDFWLDSDGS